MKRTQRVPLHDGRLGRLCLQTCALKTARDHGIDAAVHRLDPFDAGIGQFDRRQGFLTNQPAGFNGGEIAGFCHRVNLCSFKSAPSFPLARA